MNQKFKNQTHPILGIPSDHVPRHIAIIMDGNGRWAQQRGLPRVKGHGKGSLAVRPIVIESVRLGIECLTFYSFSTENWKRPPVEVETIMDLYRQYLIEERPMVMEYNVKVRHLGDKNLLPDHVIEELEKTLHASRNNTGMTLCLALNYSGRSEIVRAFKKINQDISQGKLTTDQVDENLIDSYLDTAGLPDPDL
ncbi:MAG: di-trans,poly-cis-decaprenylcistransferase, partial [Planctomycetes bacterium]|nr:di-trans,poly-cis-decaprenylcistransferase [Planctomycetota bacterium]